MRYHSLASGTDEDVKKNSETSKQSWEKVQVPQSCPTLCDPINYTVHGILQPEY